VAISPPSDLVLDVVKAADPTQVAAAQATLKANRANFLASSLAAKGDGFENAVSILNQAGSRSGIANSRGTENKAEIPATYRQFEAVVLQNFVKNMMPTDAEAVYGKGNAGEMWKSMMAEQIGATISERGGIGIAEQIYSETLARQRGHNVANVVTDERERDVAMSMVRRIELQTLGVNATEEKQV
jgi:peptidoglycan hydrolase FlgJ